MAAAPAADGRTVVVQGLGPAVDDAALSALFVFVSEGASYLYTVHPW